MFNRYTVPVNHQGRAEAQTSVVRVGPGSSDAAPPFAGTMIWSGPQGQRERIVTGGSVTRSCEGFVHTQIV